MWERPPSFPDFRVQPLSLLCVGTGGWFRHKVRVTSAAWWWEKKQLNNWFEEISTNVGAGCLGLLGFLLDRHLHFFWRSLKSLLLKPDSEQVSCSPDEDWWESNTTVFYICGWFFMKLNHTELLQLFIRYRFTNAEQWEGVRSVFSLILNQVITVFMLSLCFFCLILLL